MDLLRGFAVLLVVTYHAVINAPAPRGGVLDAVSLFVTPFRIPTLLVLSGLLLHRSLVKGPWQFTVGKLTRIALPAVIWTLACLPFGGRWVYTTSLVFWLTGTHTWFLLVLLLSYGLALVARLVRVPPWAASITLLGAGWLLAGSREITSTYLWHAGLFFAGAALLPALARILAMPVALAIGAALLGAIGGVVAYHDPSAHRVTPLWLVTLGGGVIFLMWLGFRCPSSRVVDTLSWLGKNSLVSYVVHYPLQLALAEAYVALGWAGSWLLPWLNLVVAVAVCAVVTRWRGAVEFLFTFPLPAAADGRTDPQHPSPRALPNPF